MTKQELISIIAKVVSTQLNKSNDTKLPDNNQLTIWWNNLDSDWKSIFKSAIKIQGNPTIQDLNKIVNLQSINAEHFNLKTLEPLSQLIHLKKLIVRNTAVADLRPLKNLKELRYLDMTYTMVNDLKPIWNLPKLIKIYCKRCGRLIPTQVNEFVNSHRHCEVDWDYTQDQNWQPIQTW